MSKITLKQFHYLKSLTPFITRRNLKDFNALKYALLDHIKSICATNGRKLMPKTWKAVDRMCFLATDRGFFEASPQYFAKEFKVGESTIENLLSFLREHGVFTKVNLPAEDHNGLGNPVHIFKCHPYYSSICSFLRLNEKANQSSNEKAEKAEIPSPTRIEGVSEGATISLPVFNTDKENQSNVLQSNVPTNVAVNRSKIKIVKYVPKIINEKFAHLFGDDLKCIWNRVTMAFKSIKQCMLNLEIKYFLGEEIIQRLYKLVKEKNRTGEKMSLDDMCKFTYVTARETFYNYCAEIHMETYEEDQERHEMKREEQFELAKEEISYLEKECLRNHPHACYERLKEYVLGKIKETFELLRKDDIEKLESGYLIYSSQRSMIRAYYERKKVKLA